MKLFTKEIDTKLFEQYLTGSDLENQMVVAKIFNPYGRGTWYLLNSDPEDPEYLWAIVDMDDIEVGSVNRSDLENIKIKPFMLGLERDLSFRQMNALELYEGLNEGKKYIKGGGVEKNSNYKKFGKDNLRLVNFDIDDLDSFESMQYDQFSSSMNKADALQILINNVESDYSQLNEQLAEIAEEQYPSDEFFEDNRQYKNGGSVESENKEMVLNNNKQIAHHTKELQSALKGKNVPAWVVAKVNRSASDLSDVTHYMEGQGESYADGGGVDEKNAYVVGDILNIEPKGSYEESWQLYKPINSYVIDSKTNKIISIHNTPIEALRERDKTNTNNKVHFDLSDLKMAKGGATKKEFIAKKVGKVMREFKEGDLHIGTSNKIVKNPKQAIAIGLSEGKKGWKHRRK